MLSNIVQIEERILAGCSGTGLSLTDTELERLALFSQMVFKWGPVVNLTGAANGIEFAERHVVDCLAATRFISGSRTLDVGSGAGLPGVVLAIVKPGVDIVLLDSRRRRTRFLTQVRIELALENVEVVHARVQEYAPNQQFDSIVCRAYGPLERFVADTRALHHPGCRLVALKGRDPCNEIAALGEAARACTIHRVSVPVWTERHVVIVDCAALPET